MDDPRELYVERLRANFPVMRGLPDTLDEIKRQTPEDISLADIDAAIALFHRAGADKDKLAPSVSECIGVMLTAVRNRTPRQVDHSAPRRVRDEFCIQPGCNGPLTFYAAERVLRCDSCLRIQEQPQGGIQMTPSQVSALRLERAVTYTDEEVREAMARFGHEKETA